MYICSRKPKNRTNIYSIFVCYKKIYIYAILDYKYYRTN